MDDGIVDTATAVLLVVGVVALLAPALFPVQQVLYHDTGVGTTMNGTELEARGYTVVEYENLSERGQDIYVATLRSPDRSYTVPADQGAPEFPYDGADDMDEANDREGYEERQRRTSIVIERPEDADLPPPHEPVDRIRAEPPEPEQAAASGGETATSASESARQQRLEQRRAAVGRYDLVTVRQGTPPVTDSGTLLRLGSVLLGTVGIGLGGYLRSRP
jgi:hypothetical protein